MTISTAIAEHRHESIHVVSSNANAKNILTHVNIARVIMSHDKGVIKWA